MWMQIIFSFFFSRLGPQWGKDKNEKEHLCSLIKKCIDTADRLKCNSIALPAISCGIFGTDQSLKKSSTTIKSAIHEFVTKNSFTSLRIVRLVVNSPQLINSFLGIDKLYKRYDNTKSKNNE